ncbi:MAG: class I SAM-dependent methyltransferase [bacterium]
MLFDELAGLGVSGDHAILDIGCRDASQSIELANQFNCRVIGVDPVSGNTVRARAKAADAGSSERILALQGSIEEIPLKSSSCDFVWCRDMLNQILDIGHGLYECVRVLKPGGQMLICHTFATDLLEPNEAEFLCGSLAIIPENLNAAGMEMAFASAGYLIHKSDTIASEERENLEGGVSRYTSKQLLRIAIMRRAGAGLEAEVGPLPHRVELADCMWGVYQMLGKLCPPLYILARPILPAHAPDSMLATLRGSMCRLRATRGRGPSTRAA